MYEYIARYVGLDYAVLHADSGKGCGCHACKLNVPSAAVVGSVRNLLENAEKYGASRNKTLKTLWDAPPQRLDSFVQSCDIH
mmetsp:Transcript_28483/g.95914  ORF Transcript_28483/g.95914 Transcript_28483/m.95914 type:complete len:82 (+) Transcript_28483:412-657(+)